MKPENILMEEKRLYICDFGCSISDNTNQNTPNIVSRYYRAPELCLGLKNYDDKIDVWAAGCIFIEMITGKPIFKGPTEGHQIIKILQKLGGFKKKDHKFYSRKIPMWKEYFQYFPKYVRDKSFVKELKKFFNKDKHFEELFYGIFCLNPDDRFSAEQVCESPFFDEIINRYKKLISK